MKAILFEAPRKIRLVDDMPIPEPEEGEVLVRNTHVGLCGGNVGPYTGAGHWADIDWPAPLGWQGHESLGVIVESRDGDWPAGTPVLAQDKRFAGFVEYIVPQPRSLNRLPSGIDSAALLPVAESVGVSYVPGTRFYAGGGGERYFRLSFSLMSFDELIEGAHRLGAALRDHQQ